jgi:uncharacterized protein DUF4932
MRKILQLMMAAQTITILCFGQPFKAYQPAGKNIQVHFYKNVEFLGLVFFMGSLAAQYEHDTTQIKKGIKKKDWFAYELSLFKQYRSFQNNNNLVTASRFAENMQGSDLFPFLIQLEAFPRAKITTAISPDAYGAFSEKGDTTEARKNVGVFLDALNTLYTAMNFEAYFKEHNNLYEQALQEIKSQLPSNQIIPAMEKFYRQQFDQYILLPSLTIPSGMAFASGYTTANKKTRIFNAFGPFALQHFTPGDTIDLGFADEKHLRELSIHEFGHSFTNPVLNKIPVQQIVGTKALYDTIKTAMDNQGYNVWKSCLYEHFVRAGEIVIARNLGLQKEAEQLQAYYMQHRQFIYLPVIIAELEKYNTNPAISYLDAANAVMEKFKALLIK